MRLRLTENVDIPWIRSLESNPENSPWVYQWSEEQHLEALSEPDTGHLILESHGGERVGYCILKGLKNSFGVVELMRIVIGPKQQGHGHRAMEALMEKAFTELSARRLWLDVVDANARAIALYEALGFIHEGTLRESALINGKPVSMRIYGMLSREWLQRR